MVAAERLLRVISVPSVSPWFVFPFAVFLVGTFVRGDPMPAVTRFPEQLHGALGFDILRNCTIDRDYPGQKLHLHRER